MSFQSRTANVIEKKLSEFKAVRDEAHIVTKDSFGKFKDYSNKLDQEDLINLIVVQAKKMQEENKRDLDECKNELENLDGLIGSLHTRADGISNSCQSAAASEQSCKAKIEEEKRKLTSIGTQQSEYNAKVTDLKGLIQGMDEQKNKDVQGADAKNIEAIKMIMSDGQRRNSTMQYILDKLCAILSGDQNATFATKGHIIFDATNFGSEVRKAKPYLMDKDWLSDVARQINMDAEGQAGAIQTQILDMSDPTRYLHFFCHFKVLFKLVQMGLTQKRLNNLQKKLDSTTAEVEAIQRSVFEEEQAIQNLRFQHEMSAEANRIRSEDITFLTEKKSMLTTQIQRHENENVYQHIISSI